MSNTSSELVKSDKALSREELAEVVAGDIKPGSYVNLGIGQPTKVSDYLTDESNIILHTENGLLGMGAEATGDDIDLDLTNAGKIPVSETPGASYFHHADSFGMMRGGHLDFCVMGAYQVSQKGDLANWHSGSPDAIPAVGGAMDLGIGAKDVYVMMNLFTKKGEPKIVPELTYPVTALDCVSRVYSDHGVFELTRDGVVIKALFGISEEEVKNRLTGVTFVSPS